MLYQEVTLSLFLASSARMALSMYKFDRHIYVLIKNNLLVATLADAAFVVSASIVVAEAANDMHPSSSKSIFQ